MAATSLFVYLIRIIKLIYYIICRLNLYCSASKQIVQPAFWKEILWNRATNLRIFQPTLCDRAGDHLLFLILAKKRVPPLWTWYVYGRNWLSLADHLKPTHSGWWKFFIQPCYLHSRTFYAYTVSFYCWWSAMSCSKSAKLGNKENPRRLTKMIEDS